MRNFAAALVLVTGGAMAQSASVTLLMQKNLAAKPDQEAAMSIVEYPPGGSSQPHRHHAQVFVYVLEGSLTMQVTGGQLRTLRAGDTFYEAPDDEHLVAANASTTQPAKFLVFMIKDATRKEVK